MSGSIHRTVRRSGAPYIRPNVFEALESRRLFSIVLSLSQGVLQVSEDHNGVANFTTIQIINDGAGLQIHESSDTILATNDVFNLGWTHDDNLTTFSGPETGISGILVDTLDGNDELFVPSMNLPLTIQPRGPADESIQLGQPDSPTGVELLTQPIKFDGSEAHSAHLAVEANLDPTNVDPTLTSTSLLDFAPAPITFIAPPQGSLTTPSMYVGVSTGTGYSNFVIQQLPTVPAEIDYSISSFGMGSVSVEKLNATSQVEIDAQSGGSELVRLGSLGLISSIAGKVEVNGNAGTASILVNDSADTVSHTFAITTAGDDALQDDGVNVLTFEGPITAFTLETGTATNTVDLDLSPFTTRGFTATVESNGTNDSIAVTNLEQSGEVDLVGGAGVDNVSINAGNVLGTANISNPTGVEAVSIDGSSTDTPQVITVSDSRVTGLSTGIFVLSNLKSLSVTGGAAFDNFSVTPSATVPITVDGGPASGASQDRVDVNTTGVTGTQLTLQSNDTGDTGTFTFTNRQPVSFTRFATINPSFGDLTGTVYNEQTGEVVAGARVIVDDGNLDSTTTDANGTFSFQGLPTGTFSLSAQASFLQNLADVSVTVSAGVLAPPVSIPVVPLPSVSGPDLVVTSVVATAGGKTGSIKPKVRVKISNIGESMSSAAALQIVLVASPDTVLDSTDQQLLTSSTPPILLKAKGSKTLTFSGSTAASLTKGSYFVLASVDAANAVSETNESNNVTASANAVTLAPPTVDLTGKFGRLAKSASQSKLLAVAFTIQNLGTIPAPGTIEFDFFASSDTTLDNSDVSLGTGFPVAVHVAAGKSQTAKFKLSILPSLSAGSYYLVAKVNSTSSISESDTTNNVVFSTTPIAIS